MKKFIKYIPPILAFAPFIASAQAAQDDVAGILGTISALITGTILPFLLLIAGLIFVWGVISYLTAGGEEEKMANGRKYMIWGIIGLVVILVFWGIVIAIVNTLNLTETDVPAIWGE